MRYTSSGGGVTLPGKDRLKKDWYEALHPGERAKAEKAPKPKPLANRLADLFAAEYLAPEAAAEAA